MGVSVKLMFIHVRVIKAVNLIWCIFFSLKHFFAQLPDMCVDC